MKLTKRKQFKFYRSYFDVYNELSNKDKVIFMDAMLDKQFLNKEPEKLTGMVKIAWLSLYHSIDTQVKGYETKTGNLLNPDIKRDCDPMQGGSKGGTQGPIIDPTLQEKEEEKEKVKEKNIIEREKIFKKQVFETLNTTRLKFLPFKEENKNFFEHWTEHGINDKKMRFEKQTSFSIERRLDTWHRNAQKWNKEDKLYSWHEISAMMPKEGKDIFNQFVKVKVENNIAYYKKK